MIHNGVKGLIVWPTSHDSNGEYFSKLSQTVPVVLIDRLMEGASLPSVVMDFASCGKSICRTLFEDYRKKRVLVLTDARPISPYRDLENGIMQTAEELGRKNDVTFVQIPITQILQDVCREDFSKIEPLARHLERLIRKGGYDTVFCTQDDFVDYALVQSGLIKTFPGLQLATMRAKCPNERSMEYCRQRVLEWINDPAEMVSRAADMVQQWALTRQMPKTAIEISFRRK